MPPQSDRDAARSAYGGGVFNLIKSPPQMTPTHKTPIAHRHRKMPRSAAKIRPRGYGTSRAPNVKTPRGSQPPKTPRTGGRYRSSQLPTPNPWNDTMTEEEEDSSIFNLFMRGQTSSKKKPGPVAHMMSTHAEPHVQDPAALPPVGPDGRIHLDPVRAAFPTPKSPEDTLVERVQSSLHISPPPVDRQPEPAAPALSSSSSALKLSLRKRDSEPEQAGGMFSSFTSAVMSPFRSKNSPPSSSTAASGNQAPPQEEHVVASAHGESNDSGVFPRLTREGYYTVPSIGDLQQMSEEQLKAVDNFVIGAHSYGSIRFLQPIDVRGLNLDDLVVFDTCTIEVYPKTGTKHPLGEKLNNPAIITLNTYPKAKKGASSNVVSDRRVNKHRDRLRRTTKNAGAEFISYEVDHQSLSGRWIFKVPNFD